MFVPALLLGCILMASGGYVPPGPKFPCPKDFTYFYPCTCVHGSDEGLYVRCENTNLASLSVALLNLGNEAVPIEELVLSKCNIVRFYGPALYPLSVRVLKIEDTPLKFIDEHSFLGVNRTLQELHVINSVLEKFPKEALQILGNLTILKIRGHKFFELPGDAFANSLVAANLLRMEISNGTMNSMPIEALAPLKKLKTLDLHGNELKELQKNQFRGLRDVDALDLSYNSIDKIDTTQFADLTKLSFLNLSNNAISELKRATFTRNSLLKVLNLSNNKLRKIDSYTFRGMRLMRRLYLSNNRISEVGRGTFEPMSRIGTIDLAKNMIRKIDYQMFNNLNFVEFIDVSENLVTIIERLAFKDIYLAKVNLSHNHISKIENGAFENCANITVLDFSYNKIENISKNAFDSASYASELLLSYNVMTSLNQVPLLNMSGLRVLNVSHNLIRTVPRQTFPKLYELHTIDLSYNNLTDIHNGIFQSLFSLRVLNFSHNSLDKIKPSTFGPLPTLLELDLSYNNLNDISRGSLTRLSSCQIINVKGNQLKRIFLLPISVSHLDFSENLLSDIPVSDVWPTMNALISLDLSNNLLGDSLKYKSFDSLLTLRTLNLRNNGITRPPWEALSTLASLQYVYLQDNKLTSISKAAFGKLPVVFELNLANNEISDVHENAFEGLLQLLNLNLSHNVIQRIPNGAFSGLVSLRTLDLSFNQLERIDNKTNSLLEDCLSLEKVNLSHNKFAFFNIKTLPYDQWIPYKITDVDFSHNSLSVLNFDFTYGMKKVQKLDLSHNNINEIRRYVLGNMTSLRYLDLSFNELSDLSDPDVFVPPSNLSTLILSNNQFANLPWSKIETMRNLKYLGLEHNNFHHFDESLMKALLNGTKIKFTGNPLHCDCFVRPLRRWFNAFTEIPEEWQDVECTSPSYVADSRLPDVSEALLTCSDKEILEDSRYDISPDVKYREIQYDPEDQTWKVSWAVNTREDTADFYIVIREPGDRNNILEKDVVYVERSFKIKELPEPDTTYELCVLARDSIGNVKHFRSSQCRLLDRRSTSSGNRLELSYYLVLLSVLSLTLTRICFRAIF